MPLLRWLRCVLSASTDRWAVRLVCWVVFFLPLAFYLLRGWDRLLDRPQALDVGIVAISAALGGLVLNAGLGLTSPKREEVVLVAQEFIGVVILMILFVPSLFYLELTAIDISSFKPGSLDAWVELFFFSVAAICFYGGVSLFIFALVDLAFAMAGVGDPKYASPGERETPDHNRRCGGSSISDTQRLAQGDVQSGHDDAKEYTA